MRIRRCASRLLGSACISPPPDPAPRFEPQLPLPPPPPPPRPYPSATESHRGKGRFADMTGSGQPPCELNLSPWDLGPQPDPSDSQEQEEFDETYMYCVSFRASWAIPTSLPAASVKEEEIVATVDGVRLKPRAQKTAAKKAVVKKTKKENKECELKTKKKKAKAEEGDSGDGVAAPEAQLIWTCRKNDGKRWSCHRLVRQPNSLCVHHSDKSRMCNNLLSDSKSTAAPQAAVAPAVSKLSTSSKSRRKRPVVDIGEGFYYYAGFGPPHSKRQCRPSSSMQQQEFPPPAEQKADHSAAPTADQTQADDSAYHQAEALPICDDDMIRIAGGDEESSNGEPRVVGVNCDSKRKILLKKRWRKPVKARSLKSLM